MCTFHKFFAKLCEQGAVNRERELSHLSQCMRQLKRWSTVEAEATRAKIEERSMNRQKLRVDG
jgi:hypothetical protein